MQLVVEVQSFGGGVGVVFPLSRVLWDWREAAGCVDRVGWGGGWADLGKGKPLKLKPLLVAQRESTCLTLR